MRAQFFILPTIFVLTVFMLLFIEDPYHAPARLSMDIAKQYHNIFHSVRFIKSVSYDVVNVSVAEVWADNDTAANNNLTANLDAFITRSGNLTSPLDTYSLTYVVNNATCTEMDVTFDLDLISNDLNVSDIYSVMCNKTQCTGYTGISCYGY